MAKTPYRQLPLTQALRWWRSRGVVIRNAEFDAMGKAAHQYAFTVSGVENLGLLNKLNKSLDTAIAKGQTFSDWKKQTITTLKDTSTDLPSPARLKTVFRNATQNSAMAGQWAEIQRNKDTHEYLIYDAIMDNRVRPDHERLNNLVLPVNHPYWQQIYPPNGHNCRCSILQADVDDLAEMGLTPTSQSKLRRVGPTARVDTGWNTVPGQNFEALGCQSLARQCRNLGAKSARTAWDRHIEPHRAKINDDIQKFVQSAAINKNIKGAAVTRRILPPLHDSVENLALVDITDTDVKKLLRAGVTEQQLKRFATKGIQRKPTMREDLLIWGSIVFDKGEWKVDDGV